MCIDIYLKFRDFKNTALSSRDAEDRRFLYYSAYAWGSPFVILMVTLIMDFAPGVPDSFIKPGFGKDRCWFSSKMATLAYFYGPVAVILLCNIVLFIITAVKIARIKRDTAILMDAESRRNDEIQDSNRQRFDIYLKLFIVMGVNWIAEVVSWGVGGPGYLWFLTDIGNTLQGFFIFIILVWKDRIRRLLLQKLRPHPTVINRRQGDPIKTLWYSVDSEKVSYDS
ncbi:hypothetical protein J437_LFUL010240 [Ladona fulva]|uniref:G-protein coupled receptors family 2 profile 2 domain-containing protein n=1 Tax=Ladona fulva TaxID=123851 RepID=A0A8K0KAK5_LADFU|nr:hypothetical protein J437_LFUL010240 [Ladona fulva]